MKQISKYFSIFCQGFFNAFSSAKYFLFGAVVAYIALMAVLAHTTASNEAYWVKEHAVRTADFSEYDPVIPGLTHAQVSELKNVLSSKTDTSKYSVLRSGVEFVVNVNPEQNAIVLISNTDFIGLISRAENLVTTKRLMLASRKNTLVVSENIVSRVYLQAIR